MAGLLDERVARVGVVETAHARVAATSTLYVTQRQTHVGECVLVVDFEGVCHELGVIWPLGWYTFRLQHRCRRRNPLLNTLHALDITVPLDVFHTLGVLCF